MLLKFTKMHGLGNDFVVVDRVTRNFDLSAAHIKALSDRHTGIGFDQLLVAELPSRPDADFFFHIYNADGSEAEQCGNGARCFARFVLDAGLTHKRCLTLETSTGLISTLLLEDGQVEIDMGVPGLHAADLPFATEEPAVGALHHLQVDDSMQAFTAVSMGNPHAVIEVDDLAATPVSDLGQRIATHSRFAAGVNVGFAQFMDRSLVKLRVFERVVGETRACGSGACAAVVAGVLAGKLDPEAKVSLPGGDLRIVWHGPGQPVKMTGPTGLVYNGEIKI